MKQKSLLILPLLGAAVLATACGRDYDDRDHAVAPVPRETVVTQNPNHPGRTAGDVVSDVVDDGVDIVSDVVDGGREIAGDVNSAIDDMARKESAAHDDDDNYYAGTDGRTDTQTTTRR